MPNYCGSLSAASPKPFLMGVEAVAIRKLRFACMLSMVWQLRSRDLTF